MAKKEIAKTENNYDSILTNVVELLEEARRLSARSVNAIMTATYWEIGRQIVEVEQKGEERAEYGEELLKRLSKDLSERFGKGFSRQNLQQMRSFYLGWQICQTVSSKSEIWQTPSAEFETSEMLSRKSSIIPQTMSAKSSLIEIAKNFKLPWSDYVLLLSCKNENARKFYEEETLRGGWTVRQLKRQIDSRFYERTLLSKNKVAMLKKGEKSLPEDYVSPDEEIKDPSVLEFLNLKDEYSEHDLEEAIIKHLESFLLEIYARMEKRASRD